jgi:hypothetical protein
MIPNLDIYRAAKLLLDEHGQDAPIRLYFWLTGAQRRTSYSADHRQSQSCLRRVATEVQCVAIPSHLSR